MREAGQARELRHLAERDLTVLELLDAAVDLVERRDLTRPDRLFQDEVAELGDGGELVAERVEALARLGPAGDAATGHRQPPLEQSPEVLGRAALGPLEELDGPLERLGARERQRLFASPMRDGEADVGGLQAPEARGLGEGPAIPVALANVVPRAAHEPLDLAELEAVPLAHLANQGLPLLHEDGPRQLAEGEVDAAAEEAHPRDDGEDEHLQRRAGHEGHDAPQDEAREEHRDQKEQVRRVRGDMRQVGDGRGPRDRAGRLLIRCARARKLAGCARRARLTHQDALAEGLAMRDVRAPPLEKGKVVLGRCHSAPLGRIAATDVPLAPAPGSPGKLCTPGGGAPAPLPRVPTHDDPPICAVKAASMASRGAGTPV